MVQVCCCCGVHLMQWVGCVRDIYALTVHWLLCTAVSGFMLQLVRGGWRLPPAGAPQHAGGQEQVSCARTCHSMATQHVVWGVAAASDGIAICRKGLVSLDRVFGVELGTVWTHLLA